MKKFMTFALAAIFCAMSALAAGNFGGRKVYVSPGHGTWSSEDRNLPSINHGWNDTNGFWESNTDLWKGLRMGYLLSKYGAQVKYSRVKNGDYSVVGSMADHCAACQRWGAEAFVEIHSNAASLGSTSNFGLVLYRGTDGNNYVAGSQNLGNHIWNAINENNAIDPKSAYITSANVRGDVSFYGGSITSYIDGVGYTGYLGALRHGRPGVLIEGFFHTYYPSLYRALNPDYCRQEGTRYYRRVATYFGVAGEDTGYICGVLRDSKNGFSHTYYIGKEGTLDAKAPINGGTVDLYTEDGEYIKTYTTNNEYNGVFVFEWLQPGRYIVQANKGGFGTCTMTVTVKANETTYPVMYLVPGGPIEPAPGKSGFEELWSHCAAKSNQTVGAIDATKVRNMCQFGGKLYCTYENNSIRILDGTSGDYLGELNVTGVSEGTLPLCDVHEFDGKLIATNLALAANSEPFKVYVWDSLDSAPRVILNTTNFGGVPRLGDYVGTKGNFSNGQLIFANGSKIVTYTISNGTVNASPSVKTIMKDGAEYTLGASPRVYPEGDGYMASSMHSPLLHLNSSATVTSVNNFSNDNGNAFTTYSYDGKQYAAVTRYTSNEYKNCSATIVNLSNGWGAASDGRLLPADGLGDVKNSNGTTNVCAVGGSTSATIWVQCTNQGIAAFRIGDEPIDVTGISLNKAEASVEEGSKVTLVATITPNNATNKGVNWSSSNTSVATVSNGVVTGVAEGTTTITATSAENNAIKATCEITVTKQVTPPAPTTYSFEEVWTTADVPTKADARQATVANGKLYIQDKANQKIIIYDHSGKTNQTINDSRNGTQITSDEAGNIIVLGKYGFAGVMKSDESLKVFAGGNPSDAKEIALDQNSISTRQDFIGRVRGNILSGDALMTVVDQSNTIGIWGFTDGSFDDSKSGSVEGKNVGANCGIVSHVIGSDNYFLSQQTRSAAIRLAKVEFDDIAGEYTFDDSQVLVTPDRYNSAGCDAVILNDQAYIAYNIGTGYFDGFAIAKVSTADNNEILFKHDQSKTSTSGYQTNWVLFDKVNNNSAYVYHYFPGEFITCYLLNVPGSAVDTINHDVTSANAFGTNGGIKIIGDASSVSVYSITGKAFALNAKTSFVAVPKGIYVVNLDGKAHKVIVK